MSCFVPYPVRLPRILAGSFALLLAATPSVFAATFTWDGGGTNNFLSTGANWTSNVAPPASGADLVFAGTVRLTPSVSVSNSPLSVSFSNTAGAFVIGGPSSLLVGAGGISNNDANTQTFDRSVTAVATQTINAGNGALVFNDGLIIPAAINVTLNGLNAVTIGNFGAGTGTLTKSNSGDLTLNTSDTPILAGLNLNAGTTALDGPLTSTQTIGSTGAIHVGSSALFYISRNLTLSGGAQLTGASGAFVTFSPTGDKTLRIESGSDFMSASSQTFYGGDVMVTGSGSTIQTGPGSNITVSGERTLSVLDGGSVLSGNSLALGQIGGGTLTVDGTGSSVSTTSGTSTWGTGGANAAVTFTNNSHGNFTGVDIAHAPGADADVQIRSGADITNTGPLSVAGANTALGNSGTLLVTGPGTTWQQSSGSTTIGAASGTGGTLTVSVGADFTTDGSMTIGAAGTVNVDGGSLSVGGPFSNSGTLDFVAGTLELLGPNTLTVGTGGLFGQSLTLAADRELAIGGTTTVDASRTLTLSGGTLSTGGMDIHGTLNFGSGTLVITSNGAVRIEPIGIVQTSRSINGSIAGIGASSTINVNASGIALGSSAALNGFNHQGVLNVGVNTVTLNSAGYAKLGALTTLAGGIINAPNGVAFAAGSNFLGHGTINARVSGDGGSVVEADGELVMGNTALPAGFKFGGELRTRQHTITLGSSTAVGIGNLTTLGSGIRPGTLVAANGLVVDYDEAITGYGTVESANSPTKRTIINGVAQGNSAAEPLTFTGYVKGIGTFDHVVFMGTFSPGLSPATVYLGSAVYAPNGTLVIELGGATSGSENDRLVHSGIASFAGTLDVDLLGGFAPGIGSEFVIATYAGHTGTFNSLSLPPLASGLDWTLDYGSTLLTLSVSSTRIPGDIDLDLDVDRADVALFARYFGTTNGAIWTTGDFDFDNATTLADLSLLQANLGQDSGQFAAASAVPEPSTLLLAACGLIAIVRPRLRRRSLRLSASRLV